MRSLKRTERDRGRGAEEGHGAQDDEHPRRGRAHRRPFLGDGQRRPDPFHGGQDEEKLYGADGPPLPRGQQQRNGQREDDRAGVAGAEEVGGEEQSAQNDGDEWMTGSPGSAAGDMTDVSSLLLLRQELPDHRALLLVLDAAEELYAEADDGLRPVERNLSYILPPVK